MCLTIKSICKSKHLKEPIQIQFTTQHNTWTSSIEDASFNKIHQTFFFSYKQSMTAQILNCFTRENYRSSYDLHQSICSRSTMLCQTSLHHCVSKTFLYCYVTKGLLLCASKVIHSDYSNILVYLPPHIRPTLRKKVYLIISFLNCSFIKCLIFWTSKVYFSHCH